MKTTPASCTNRYRRSVGTLAFALFANLYFSAQDLQAQGNASPGGQRRAEVRGDEADGALTAQFGDGWYAEETSAAGPFRWMGAVGHLDVTNKHAGTMVIRGKIRSIVPENGVELLVDDKVVQTIKPLGPDWQDCLLRVPLSAGTHHLSLRSRQAGSQPAGDNRVLTICLENFQARLEP